MGLTDRQLDDAHCAQCVHGDDNGQRCLYLAHTGQRRGCDPGVHCSRFRSAGRAYAWQGRGNGRAMHPLDQSALSALLRDYSFREIMRRTGIATETLRVTQKRGTVSETVAAAILAAYGLDIIQH